MEQLLVPPHTPWPSSHSRWEGGAHGSHTFQLQQGWGLAGKQGNRWVGVVRQAGSVRHVWMKGHERFCVLGFQYFMKLKSRHIVGVIQFIQSHFSELVLAGFYLLYFYSFFKNILCDYYTAGVQCGKAFKLQPWTESGSTSSSDTYAVSP